MIASPVILYPKTDWTSAGEDKYYTDSLVQLVSGSISTVYEENTFLSVQYRYRIDNAYGVGTYSTFSYTGITVGSSATIATSIPWSFNSDGIFSTVVGDIVRFEFRTVKLSSYNGEVGPILDQSAVSVLNVFVVEESTIQASSNPPTGVKLKRYTDRIKVLAPSSGIMLNKNCSFAGCNFYVSLEAGGGASGYVQMNTALVTAIDSSETEEVILSDTVVSDTTNNIQINTVKNTQVTNEYFTYTLDKTVISRLVRDGKIPNIFLTDGKTLSEDVVYYFIVTDMVFDSSFNEVEESPYSIELEAKFLRYTTSYHALPKRSRSDILFAISRDMMVNNELVNVVPGSVIRDILDPVSLEFEKFYVIEDFIFSTLSIDTLLYFDDPNGTGTSIPVLQDQRKSALMVALGLSDPINLQLLIDEQFDKSASNFNITRKGSSAAVGTVLFYSEIVPTQDILIPDGAVVSSIVDPDTGAPSVSFSVQGSVLLSVRDINHYYNSSLKRYEIEANIRAITPGSASNVPAGVITISRNLIPTIQVINNAPTLFGTDRETNLGLANRIKLAKVSYDSGTEGGYEDTAYNIPGVLQARIEKAGDPLMMRDYDMSTGTHIGGKVDVYVKGVQKNQYIDQVAFRYDYPTDTYGNKVGEQFSVVNASELMLRTPNPKVTDTSPIVSVSRVRNISRSENYSLTGMQIVNGGNTVLLEKNYQNLSVGMATKDVVEVSYLYRSSNSVVLANQPVISIVSVVSSQGTIIDPSKYLLVKTEDPLQNGSSSIAKDSVQFLFNENDDIQEFIQVNDEEHVMLLDTPARLLLKGVDISTVVVSPTSGIDFIRDVDYSLTVGSESAYTYVNLLDNSKIRHGDTVQVTYKASENFNVTYVHNGLVQVVQEAITKMKHACADTIVKEAVQNFADISFQVYKKTGVDSSLLKSRIQTAVANYVARLKMGDSFTQGALINVIHGVTGVKEIRLPLLRMMKRNSSFIPLDDLGALTFEVYQKTSGSGVASYRTVHSVLTYTTSNGGGDSNLFRGVYEDNILLTAVTVAGDVAKSAGRAYIQADGKIIVSTTDGLPPQTKYYKASYYTYYPADVNPVVDLTTSTMEYLDVDSLSMKDIDVLDEKITKRGL
jgi:hypothetical protein